MVHHIDLDKWHFSAYNTSVFTLTNSCPVPYGAGRKVRAPRTALSLTATGREARDSATEKIPPRA